MSYLSHRPTWPAWWAAADPASRARELQNAGHDASWAYMNWRELPAVVQRELLYFDPPPLAAPMLPPLTPIVPPPGGRVIQRITIEQIVEDGPDIFADDFPIWRPPEAKRSLPPPPRAWTLWRLLPYLLWLLVVFVVGYAVLRLIDLMGRWFNAAIGELQERGPLGFAGHILVGLWQRSPTLFVFVMAVALALVGAVGLYVRRRWSNAPQPAARRAATGRTTPQGSDDDDWEYLD